MFLIADTFTASLARLTAAEQKAVKTTAFELQLSTKNYPLPTDHRPPATDHCQPATDHCPPATTPGMKFHRLDRARDKNFWSIRISADIRLIVHRTPKSLMLCYVDHHDKAYEWAQRRKLETHPQTGAAQLVEIHERVEEIVVPQYVADSSATDDVAHSQGGASVTLPDCNTDGVTAVPPACGTPRKSKGGASVTLPDDATDGVTAVPPATAQPLFAHVAERDLLGYGVPQEWLPEVFKATEDSLFDLIEHLPGEAAEALLELATGGRPVAAKPVEPVANPLTHPDAQRRFREITSQEELQRALEFPWEKWSFFLHPEQRQLVECDYNGPARVTGSAGTGKTIVALHRAVSLARRHDHARVLLTTFSTALASDLKRRLNRLVRHEPLLAERVEVLSLADVGRRLHRALLGPVKIAAPEAIQQMIEEAAGKVEGHNFSSRFLISEWEQVVDAWQLQSWEDYRDVARLGRKTRLNENLWQTLWAIFAQLRSALETQGLLTETMMFDRLAAAVAQVETPSYDFVVVDEAQDIGVAHLKLFAAIGRTRPNSLFFAGDMGQRIFQQPFSWLSLGIDVRGRSRTLRVNYRTSQQIRTQSDRLLDAELTDIDGHTETRRAISLFQGPQPFIRTFATTEEESADVAKWLQERLAEGIQPHECAIFVRSGAELVRAATAVEQAGVPGNVLDENVRITNGEIAIATMHLAKGLEFKAVAIMACDDEIIPLQERIEAIGDTADLQEIYDTERHLLYVACTRARDQLLITALRPASEFLEDMVGSG